jgi:hypothetical protein
MNGTSCFLDQPGWQDVFLSATLQNDLWSERSELVMTLWPHLVVIPGLFKTTEAHICCRHLGNDAVETLITRILRQSTTLLIWHKRHETELEPPKALAPSEHDTSDSTPDMLSVLKQIRRNQLRNSYLIGLLILSRLLSALAPARLTYWEKRTQSLAHQIIALKEQIQRSHQPIFWGLFGTSILRIADATIQTGDFWGGRTYEEGEVLDWHTFAAWCSKFGRKVMVQNPRG